MEMSRLVEKLHLAFPQFTFVAATRTCWSPETYHVYYNAERDKVANVWGLLHELGHAVLGHRTYDTDMDLLQKEVAAWDKATTIAKRFNVSVDENYAQDCLETYRCWLYKRSTCPACGAHGIQNQRQLYCCLNCKARWSVSTSRFCRPYRGKFAANKTMKSQDSSWLFIENAT